MHLPSEAELALRMVMAAGLGGLIGLEREINEHPAGLRTHMSVALGAALFGIVSAFGFGEFRSDRNATNFTVDVSRVASQVVVGVGFLGGGAILKQGATVRGLTTAASLWVTAAIGLATGLGSYLIAAVTTAILMLSLVALRRPREWVINRVGRGRRPRHTAMITVADEAGASEVLAVFSRLERVRVRHVAVQDRAGATIVRVDFEVHEGLDPEEALAALIRDPRIQEMDVH